MIHQDLKDRFLSDQEESVIEDVMPVIRRAYPDPEHPHLLPMGYSIDRQQALKDALMITGCLMSNEDEIGCLGCYFLHDQARAARGHDVCKKTKMSLKHRIWMGYLSELEQYRKIGIGALARRIGDESK